MVSFNEVEEVPCGAQGQRRVPSGPVWEAVEVEEEDFHYGRLVTGFNVRSIQTALRSQ